MAAPLRVDRFDTALERTLPQQGRSAIPRSVTPSRIAVSFGVFDLGLTADRLAPIDALDRATGSGWSPSARTA